MITLAKAYKTSDGKIFYDIIDSQKHEMKLILLGFILNLGDFNKDPEQIANNIGNYIIDNKDNILRLLNIHDEQEKNSKKRRRRSKKEIITDANRDSITK